MKDLKKITESNFDILAMETYAEMEKMTPSILS